ncbi:MAG TPA: sigma-70 family RNA polymerase sigma factor [Planctomycetota bacterium]|nr:sigma-70 family RNA polymerase sigma factor [Planctomycetota bacterium]
MQSDTARLFEGAAGGDPAALGALLEAYLPRLHAFVQARLGPGLEPRESSMDVVQSVCRQILATRTVADFEGEHHFQAWLFTCALNKVREKHRFHRLGRRDVAREEPAPLAATALADLLTPSQDAVGKETADALAASLAALSPEHREVITLARLHGLPQAVIAEVMGRSEPAVRQLLGRALLRLTRELRARGVAFDGR